MLIPFFSFLLALIALLIIDEADIPASANNKNKNINGIITTPSFEKRWAKATEELERRERINEQIKSMDLTIEPAPPKKIDINKSLFEQSNILPSGVIKK